MECGHTIAHAERHTVRLMRGDVIPCRYCQAPVRVMQVRVMPWVVRHALLTLMFAAAYLALASGLFILVSLAIYGRVKW